jgi:hypothetical protein
VRSAPTSFPAWTTSISTFFNDFVLCFHCCLLIFIVFIMLLCTNFLLFSTVFSLFAGAECAVRPPPPPRGRLRSRIFRHFPRRSGPDPAPPPPAAPNGRQRGRKGGGGAPRGVQRWVRPLNVV